MIEYDRGTTKLLTATDLRSKKYTQNAAQQAAVALQLQLYYAHISVGTQRAVVGGLQRACSHVISIADADAARRSTRSRRARRTHFRTRPPTRSYLLTRMLPSRSTWTEG